MTTESDNKNQRPWTEFFATLADEDAKEMLDAIEEAFEQVEEP